jgi:hypothetical protein
VPSTGLTRSIRHFKCSVNIYCFVGINNKNTVLGWNLFTLVVFLRYLLLLNTTFVFTNCGRNCIHHMGPTYITAVHNPTLLPVFPADDTITAVPTWGGTGYTERHWKRVYTGTVYLSACSNSRDAVAPRLLHVNHRPQQMIVVLHQSTLVLNLDKHDLQTLRNPSNNTDKPNAPEEAAEQRVRCPPRCMRTPR